MWSRQCSGSHRVRFYRVGGHPEVDFSSRQASKQSCSNETQRSRTSIGPNTSERVGEERRAEKKGRREVEKEGEEHL